MSKTKYTFCRICECACGLEITVENNRITRIAPDKEHVATRGFACRKGVRYDEFVYSSDRILHPMKRRGSTWENMSWEQAISEIGGEIKRLIGQNGPHSIAINSGSALAFNFAGSLVMNGILEGLKSVNIFGDGSVDCNNKFVVQQEMYGSAFRLPFPDLANTKMFIAIGANPAVSQMTFIQAPNAIKKIKAIVERGGRVVFVNPRLAESAKITGEQIYIRPDTDIFFLLAFLNELIRSDGVSLEHVSKYMNGYDVLKRICESWTPERTAEVTAIPADTTRDLVKAFSQADGACLYCATGVNQGTNGTLAFWILEAINAVSGNLDRRGGTIVGHGLFDMPRLLKKQGKYEVPNRTRVGNLPSVCDVFPAGALADEILTPGDRQIKALINIGGNPVITYPNPDKRLERALERLELMVHIDPFRNETGNYAHYILPTTVFMERPDLPMVLHWMAGAQPVRYVQYTGKVVEPPEDVREESWIFAKLALAADIPLFGLKPISALFRMIDRLEQLPFVRGKTALTPNRIIGMALRIASGAAPLKKQIERFPHGQMLEPNLPGTFLGKRVLTDDKKIHLAPDMFVKEAAKLEADFQCEIEIKNRYKLISKRERLTHNSWTHNLPYFVHPDRTVNYLYINPADARKLNLKENDRAEVSTPRSRVTIPVRVSEDVMPGVVAFPHGWGHEDADGLSIARKNPGVSANLLTPDGPGGCERLSGMSHMTGIAVDVRKA